MKPPRLETMDRSVAATRYRGDRIGPEGAGNQPGQAKNRRLARAVKSVVCPSQQLVRSTPSPSKGPRHLGPVIRKEHTMHPSRRNEPCTNSALRSTVSSRADRTSPEPKTSRGSRGGDEFPSPARRRPGFPRTMSSGYARTRAPRVGAREEAETVRRRCVSSHATRHMTHPTRTRETVVS